MQTYDFLTPLVSFVGALVGASFGPSFTYLSRRAAVGDALAGEIQATTKEIHKRSLVKNAEELIKSSEAKNIHLPVVPFSGGGGQETFPVYSTLRSEIGLLRRDDARKVVEFYAIMLQIRPRLDLWNNRHWSIHGLTREQKAGRIAIELAAFRRAEYVGLKVATRLLKRSWCL